MVQMCQSFASWYRQLVQKPRCGVCKSRPVPVSCLGLMSSVQFHGNGKGTRIEVLDFGVPNVYLDFEFRQDLHRQQHEESELEQYCRGLPGIGSKG